MLVAAKQCNMHALDSQPSAPVMSCMRAEARTQQLSKHKATLGEQFASGDQEGLLRWALAQLADAKNGSGVASPQALRQPSMQRKRSAKQKQSVPQTQCQLQHERYEKKVRLLSSSSRTILHRSAPALRQFSIAQLQLLHISVLPSHGLNRVVSHVGGPA